MRFVTCLAIVLLALGAVGCQEQPTTPSPLTDQASPGLDPARAAAEIMSLAAFPLAEDAALPADAAKALAWVVAWDREELAGGVAHYAFTLKVGWGQHDRIVLHRVVRETRPGRPVRTDGNIFLQHGDGVGFVKFLFGPAAPSVPDDFGAAIHLAAAGVDVWGIDQNWVLVPAETTDFAFMAEWGLDNQIDNLRAGLAVARLVRLLSGEGGGPLNLLGYSSGGATGYALLDREAGLPAAQRHVAGFVCADMLYRYAPEYEGSRAAMCADADYLRSRLDAGEHVETIPFVPIGELAALDPEGESPFIPGFTNLQTALFFGAATFQVWPFSEWWHYWGGVFDAETGMPTDLRFTPLVQALDFMRTACPWETLRFLYEYEWTICGEGDIPWDDNFARVEVPLLILAPVGGLGEAGVHTASLTASTDVEILRVGLLDPDQWGEDFGHIDLWTAPAAPGLVWDPLLAWIRAHSVERGPGRHGQNHGS